MAQKCCCALRHAAANSPSATGDRFIFFDTRQTQRSLVDKTNVDASNHVVTVEAVAIFEEIGAFKVE
jgi:hypothetical protein